MMNTPAFVAAIAGLLVVDPGVSLAQGPQPTPVLLAPALPLPDPIPPPPAPTPTLLAPVGPRAKESREGNYELRPAKDGSGELTYDGAAFAARISVDGGVSFHDRRVRDLSALPPFLPAPVANGVPSLQATLSSVLRGKKAPAVQPDVTPDESFLIIPMVSRYRPDPREGCRTCDFSPYLMPFNVTGKADLTDALTRLSGQDPNRLEKARFLTATRELRVRMAARAHAVWVRQASANLPARLDTIACDTRMSVAERRAILEALADEMDATPAGRDAAARIDAFLTARFGSPPDASAVCPARLPRP